MKLVVLGNDAAWNELTNNNDDIVWQRADSFRTFFENTDATAFFNLNEDAYLNDYHSIDKPVFINSVSHTLKEINAAKNIVRINGWHGFINRNTWEVAGDLSESHVDVLNALQKKFTILADEPGFVTARIIAMIINEAYFAKGENVSTENEIDIAMKLGTNYPYGPFEWSQEIGIKNIYALLIKLSDIDSRYKPAPLLEQKVKAK